MIAGQDSIELRNLQESLANANDRAERFRIALSKREMQLEAMECDLDVLNSEIIQLRHFESTSQQLQSQVKELELRIVDEQQERAEQLNVSNSREADMKLRFDKTLLERDTQIANLTTEISSLHEGYQDMDTALSERMAVEARVSQDLVQVKSELETKCSDLETSRLALEKLEQIVQTEDETKKELRSVFAQNYDCIQAEMSTLNHSLVALAHNLETAEAEKACLLSEMNANRVKHSEAANDFENTIRELNKKLHSGEEEHARLRSQLDSEISELNATVSALQLESSAATEKLVKVETELVVQQNLTRQLEARLDLSERDILSKNVELKALQTEGEAKDFLIRELQVAEEEGLRADAELNRRNMQISDMENEREELVLQLEELTKEREICQLKSQKSIAEMSSKLSELEKNLEERNKTIEYMEAHETRNVDIIQDLESQILKQKETVAQMHIKLKSTEEKDTEISKLQSTITALKSSVEQGDVERKKLLKNIEGISAEHKKNCVDLIESRSASQQKHEQILAFKKQLQEISTEHGRQIEKLTQDNHRLKEIAAKYQIRFEELKQQHVEAMKQDLTDNVDKDMYEDTIANLSERIRELEPLQDMIMALTEERDMLRKKVGRQSPPVGLAEIADNNKPHVSVPLKSILKRDIQDAPRSPMITEVSKKSCNVDSPLRKKQNFNDAISPPPPILKSLQAVIEEEEDTKEHDTEDQENVSMNNKAKKHLPPPFPSTKPPIPPANLKPSSHLVSSAGSAASRRISFMSNAKARAELGPTEKAKDEKCNQQ